MKALISIYIFLLIGITAAAQVPRDNDVAPETQVVQAPAAVEDEFYRAYPDVADVHWKTDGSQRYVGNFVWNERRYNVIYETDGTWVETATPVVINDAPARAQEDLLTRNTGWKLIDVSMVDAPFPDQPGAQRLFRFTIQDGDEVFELIYDEEGNLVQ